MKNAQRFSVLIWTDKRKADSQGNVPLYARITYIGKRTEISIGRKIDPKKWDSETGYVKGPGQDVKDLNSHLIQVSNDIYAAYYDLKRSEDFITVEMIKAKYTGEGQVRKMLLEAFDEHNKQMSELVGKDIVKGTLTKYTTIREKVSDYIQYRFRKSDIYLNTLEYSFITGFEHYLKTEKLISHNVAMSYIKRVKRIVNIAVDNKWLAASPFKEFVCTSKKTTRTELEEQELKALREKRFTVSRLAEVRDCYLFSCYTGYAFVDAYKLTPHNIITGNDGEIWIVTDRTKSKIDASVPLLPQAAEIIDRYKDHPYCLINNRLLPMKSNQKMNAYLKEIAGLCGIEKNLTTHTARHTFATTVTLENGVPIETVSKMLGHTKITTTQIYARVKRKKISQDMKMLREKLNCS
jgi:site-specific recombinase XerD